MSDGGHAAAPECRTLLFVCHGPSCSERGSPETCRRLREAIAASPARRAVRVCETTCLDNCATGPNVVVGHEGQIRSGVKGAEVEALLGVLIEGVRGRQRERGGAPRRGVAAGLTGGAGRRDHGRFACTRSSAG